MTTTTRRYTDADATELDRTRPCRITWCDRTCRWASDPNHDVVRVHQRSVDQFTLSHQETVDGGLHPDGPVVAFPSIEHVTLDEARAMTSTLLYLTGRSSGTPGTGPDDDQPRSVGCHERGDPNGSEHRRGGRGSTAPAHVIAQRNRAVTERHYLRRTHEGPDARALLESFGRAND